MAENIKATMAQEAKKAKLLNIIAPLKLNRKKAETLVEGLISKYGDNARDLVIALMNHPYEAMPVITADKKHYLSKSALEYVNEHDVSVENLAKMLKKDKKTVANLMPHPKTAKVSQSNHGSSRQILRKELKEMTRAYHNKEVNDATRVARLPEPYLLRDKKFNRAVDSKTPAPQIHVNWFGQNKTKPWVPQEIKDNTPETIYKKAVMNINDGAITIDDLLKKAGVKAQDFQTLINKEVTLDNKAKLIKAITPGRRNKTLASAADRTTGSCAGDCLSGVQRMLVPNIYTDATSPLSAVNPQWKKYTKRGEKNEASDARFMLDSSGDFITLAVNNEAYMQPGNSQGNKNMKKFNRSLPAGTIAITERNSDKSKGLNNKGSKAGHIWVKDNKGRSCSDGVQPDGPADFNRYGKHMFVCLSRDCKIPKEMALKLIEIAQTRQQLEERERLACYNRSKV